jgi:hypothetical protein
MKYIIVLILIFLVILITYNYKEGITSLPPVITIPANFNTSNCSSSFNSSWCNYATNFLQSPFRYYT